MPGGRIQEMKQYLDALQHILVNGKQKDDRTGKGTRSVFGYQMRFNLQDGFPAVTTKQLMWKAVVSELLWFLEGSSDERRLCEILHGTRDPNKRTIWTDNANKQGVELGYRNDDEVKELGPVYGKQWRKWGPRIGEHIDQVANLIDQLKNDPTSRRHILTGWNVGEIEQMALPPCHLLSQFDVTDGKLSCQLYQRSCDMFLGVPFNIASYSLLTHIIAKEVGLEVGDFVWTGGDCHIYNTHMTQVAEQLSRSPKPLPTLVMADGKSIDQYQLLDFKLDGYKPDPSIPAEMAV